MDKQRVFLAIPVPETVKHAIAQAVFDERASFRQARWIPEDNWHITVIPPQYWDEDEIRYNADILQDAAGQSPFVINLKAIVLGPNQKNPRMIWISGESDPDNAYRELQQRFVSALEESGVAMNMPMRGADSTVHITLARFPSIFGPRLQWEDKMLHESFTVDRLELWHVDLKPAGAEYAAVGTIELAIP